MGNSLDGLGEKQCTEEHPPPILVRQRTRGRSCSPRVICVWSSPLPVRPRGRRSPETRCVDPSWMQLVSTSGMALSLKGGRDTAGCVIQCDSAKKVRPDVVGKS